MAGWKTENGGYWKTESGENWGMEELYNVSTRIHVPDIQILVGPVNDKLLALFESNPQSLREIPPRKFEEIVAEIYHKSGYDVELTPKTCDGGFDILAVSNSRYTGSSRYLVECKRYAESNKVGVGVVRSLLGSVHDKNATKGVVVTTSFFTRGARKIEESNNHQLSLADFDLICEWLKGI